MHDARAAAPCNSVVRERAGRYARVVTTRWLFARILLPFPLSGGILSVLPLVLAVTGTLPGPYDFVNKVTATIGIVLGLAAMLGLRQRAPVHLPVRGHGQRSQRHEGGRNHIRRQSLF